MRQADCMIVQSCQSPLVQGKKYISVRLLTGEIHYCVVEAKTKVQGVLDEIGSYIGIKDVYLFGLATFTDNEYIFLNQENKLSKVAPKQWKAQSNNGLDGAGRPTVSLYLRIQFYVDCHLLIREKVARYHYYLQLRENVLKYRQQCSDEQYFLLSSIALQADVGNYVKEQHVGQYFVVDEYFPTWVIDRLGIDYVVQNMPSMHKDAYGLGRGEAQMNFISQASYLNNPFNIHVHKLLPKKNDVKNFLWLAISPKGLELYLNAPNGFMELLTTFMWNDIKKLCFEKKKFEIRVASYPDIRKYTYYTSGDEKARYLLHLCKLTHQLVMALKPTIVELKSQLQDGKQIYRESYIYSDNFDLEWEQEHGLLNMSYKDFGTLPKMATGNKCDQRISVISNASSNTTSGIVSDRVQSLDGSEDDLDLEVMIDCPAAESTESLPAAISEDKQWSALPCYRSSSATDFAFQDCKDNFLLPKKKSGEPLNEHLNLRACIATVARNDSSSSYQSISTVRSCSQKNAAGCECKSCANFSAENGAHQLKSNKEARISLSLNSLPKLDVLGYFDSSFDNHRYHHSKDLTRENVPVVNQKTHPVSQETNTTAKSKPPVPSNFHNSRILTSISTVSAPIVPPPNINFQLPHVRTKIGVSSLSRPTQGGRLSLTLNDATSAASNKPRSEPEPFKYSPTTNLPPTPLFNADDDTLPKYEPVILPMEFNASKISCQSTPAKVGLMPSEKCDGSLRMSLTGSGYANDGELKLDAHDYFIPPPPLYANSTSSLSSDLQDSDCASQAEKSLVERDRANNVASWMAMASPGFAAKTSQERSKLAALQSVNVDLSFEEDCNNNIGNDFSALIIPPPPMNLNQSFEDGRRETNSLHSSETAISPGHSPTLDIATLRKRSKDLDLPLISALCNDQSLMKLTNLPRVPSRRTFSDATNKPAIYMNPPSLNRPVSWHFGSDFPVVLQESGKVKNGLCHVCNSNDSNSLPFAKAVPEVRSLTKASSVNCLTKYSIAQSVVALDFESTPNGSATMNHNFVDISIA